MKPMVDVGFCLPRSLRFFRNAVRKVENSLQFSTEISHARSLQPKVVQPLRSLAEPLARFLRTVVPFGVTYTNIQGMNKE